MNTLRNILKTVWKYIMKVLVKIYANNYSLYVNNYPKNLDNKDFYSQFGQDIYAFDKIFNKERDGFFVDVGANHPIEGSNTYLFEMNGWNGLAIEPQDHLRNLWPEKRKVKCLSYVIGPENKMIDFIEGSVDEHGLSGVIGYNKVKAGHKIKTIEQKRLSDVLLENGVQEVDFLSIDVEGYEMNVLQSIDFDKNNIQVICVENDINFTYIPFIGKKIGSELGNNKIRKYLINRGYKYVARIVCDDFFVKKIK